MSKRKVEPDDKFIQLDSVSAVSRSISDIDLNFFDGISSIASTLADLFLTHTEVSSPDPKVIGNAILLQLRAILDDLDLVDDKRELEYRRELKLGVEFLWRGLECLGRSDNDEAARHFATSYSNGNVAIDKNIHKQQKVLAAIVAIASAFCDIEGNTKVQVDRIQGTMTRLYGDAGIQALYDKAGLLHRSKHRKIQGEIENLARVIWSEQLPGLTRLSLLPSLTTQKGRTVQPALLWHGTLSLWGAHQKALLTSAKNPLEIREALSVREVKLICCAIEANTYLTCLHLENNGLYFEAIRLVAHSLEGNENITELYIRMNKIGDDGAAVLAKSLALNKKIVTLDMWNSGIQAAGGVALAEMLKVNSSIERINLRDNNIGDEGANAIADALSVNKRIKKLHLERCGISSDVKSRLRGGECAISL